MDRSAENRFAKFIENLIKVIIYGTILFSLLAVAVCVVVFMKRFPESFSYVELVWIIPGLLLLAGIYYAAKFFQKRDEKLLVISMTVIEIILGTLVILTYNTQPVMDYSGLWEAAKDMAANDFPDAFDPASYIYRYNWQTGMAFLESLFIRVFGPNFTVLKIFSCILTIVIDYLIYVLCKNRFGYKTACYAYVTAAAFTPWVLSIPQLSNHHVGMVFLLLSLNLINRDKWYTWLSAGLLTAVMNVVRPLGIIVLLAAFCLAVYKIIKTLNLKYIIKFAALMMGYIVVMICFNHLFLALGYTDMNISDSRVPYFKFQKGLYGYQTPITDLPDYDFDYDRYNAAMKEELKDKLKNDIPGIVRFVAEKTITYFGLYDYQFLYTYNSESEVYGRYPVKALYSIGWFQYAGLLILCLFGLKSYFKRTGGTNIFQIFFVGNTLVYIFIEAMSSYRFESYFFIIILAAAGMERIEKKISQKRALKKSSGGSYDKAISRDPLL